MNSLILATAALRLNNLYEIANSIDYAYNFNKEYLDNIVISWCICVDKYNADLTDLDNIVEFIKKKLSDKIFITIIRSGKENQKNYGGDMFNAPIEYTVKCLKDFLKTDVHNWIYVLDDDNILHPHLLRAYAGMLHNMPENYSMMWLTKIRHTGMVDSPYSKYVLDYAKKCDSLPSYLCPDPSQIIFEYEKIISKYGEMPGGSDYDYKWYVPIVIRELNEGNVVISNEYFFKEDEDKNIIFNGDKILATHNCIRNLSALSDDSSKEVMYVNISKDLLNESNTYFILSEEIRDKIKELIKEDIGKYRN